jgi:hypothetical protein
MNMARWGLLGLFVLTILVFVLYACHGGDQTKEIFDFYKVAVPPIITLILGAYFRHTRE